MKLYITTGTEHQVIQNIQAGNLDLGIVTESIEDGPAEKDIRYERLYTEQYDFVVSEKHTLAKRKTLEWSNLKDVPIILLSRESRIRRQIEARFEEANVIPNVTMELENEEAVETMINISSGAGFLAKRRIDNSRLIGLSVGDKPITVNVAAVYRNSYTPRSIREFLRICNHSLYGQGCLGTPDDPDLKQ